MCGYNDVYRWVYLVCVSFLHHESDVGAFALSKRSLPGDRMPGKASGDNWKLGKAEPPPIVGPALFDATPRSFLPAGVNITQAPVNHPSITHHLASRLSSERF